MENYRELANSVQEIYRDAGKAFGEFQAKSKLNCITGCGKCCLNPNITASQLEMLPYTLELIENGTAQEVYEKLCSIDFSSGSSCILYEKTSSDGLFGKCGAYQNRPSICRSFGASARLNKRDEKEWVVCALIKEKHKEHLVVADIEASPIMGQFASMVSTLNPYLGDKQYPINEALLLILNKVLMAYGYEAESIA